MLCPALLINNLKFLQDLFCVCQMRVHNTTLFSCMRSQEQSSPAFPFLPLAKKNIVQLQSRLPQIIYPCWQTTGLKCFLTCALTTTASSSSVKPECQLPFQGKTCCSICGAEAKHLGRKSTQVCYKTQQSCCA